MSLAILSSLAALFGAAASRRRHRSTRPVATSTAIIDRDVFHRGRKPGNVAAMQRQLSRAARLTEALLRRPGAGLAVLRAWITGKRLRARQSLLALAGAEHRLELPPAWRAALAGPADPPSSEIEVLDLDEAAGQSRSTAGLVVLRPESHSLVPGALAALAAAFRSDPAIQLVYGDAVERDGTCDRPILRPAFDPDFLLARDYIGPVVAIRREMLNRVGLDRALGDAAVADLALRVAARLGEGAVRHVPRIVSTAPAPASPQASGMAGAARLALERAKLSARVRTGEDGLVRIDRALPDPVPLVSLIVPTRDRVDLLRVCIGSLLDWTDWPALEIIVVDNDSREPEALDYLRELDASGAARVFRWPGPFDFAALNNDAAKQARGALLGFVNNDVEAFRPDWLRWMAVEALRPEVGAVGAKLLDAEGRIQHGGIVLGTGGGMATHAHRFFAGYAPGYLDRLRATHRVSAVTAACLVVESRKFDEIGGFDADSFAVDFNDVDLCLRLDAAGYRTMMVPRAVLHHREAASRRWTPEARARHDREATRLRQRWGPDLAADRWYHPGFDPDLGTYVRLRPEPPQPSEAAGPR